MLFFCFYYALEHPLKFSITGRAFIVWRERNNYKKIEKRFNKNTRLTDGEINTIKDKFITARNKKGNPR